MNIPVENAIKLLVYQLPFNICHKLISLGGLESIDKLKMLARTLDTHIEDNYVKSM